MSTISSSTAREAPALLGEVTVGTHRDDTEPVETSIRFR